MSRLGFPVSCAGVDTPSKPKKEKTASPATWWNSPGDLATASAQNSISAPTFITTSETVTQLHNLNPAITNPVTTGIEITITTVCGQPNSLSIR